MLIRCLFDKTSELACFEPKRTPKVPLKKIRKKKKLFCFFNGKIQNFNRKM
jgi:hypothetical protein